MSLVQDIDVPTAETSIEYYVLGMLQRDHRTWLTLVKNHVADGFSVPKSKSPHMHPHSGHLPCMFCTAHSGEISAVSAAVLLSMCEEMNHDDLWNSSAGRRPHNIVDATRKALPSDSSLELMFGANWVMVLALAYRVEFADAEEIVTLLRKAMEIPQRSTCSTGGVRDWSHSARWLLTAAMSGNRQPTHHAARQRTRELTGKLTSLAVAVSEDGNSGAAEDTVSAWTSSMSSALAPTITPAPLRIVR